MKRRFTIEIDCNGWYLDTLVLELDQKVIDAVDDDWRSMFYDLHTPEDIAEHIAFNLIVNKARLHQLDGWANLTDDMAKIMDYPFDPEYTFSAIEQKEVPNAKRTKGD